jgi:hypothetical protein
MVYDLKGLKVGELSPDSDGRFFTADIPSGVYIIRAGAVVGTAGLLRIERK